MSTTPVATKLMILRHAEKPPQPPQVPPPFGITANGDQAFESLTVRGWQRAGALVSLFVPSPGQKTAHPALALPAFVYATAVKADKEDDAAKGDAKIGSKSHRPQETITPLLEKLGPATRHNFSFNKGEEAALVAAAMACKGVVLICWQHEKIPVMAASLPINPATPVPKDWPVDGSGAGRYDLIWVFDLNPKTGQYAFSQIFQCLLAGDLPN